VPTRLSWNELTVTADIDLYALEIPDDGTLQIDVDFGASDCRQDAISKTGSRTPINEAGGLDIEFADILSRSHDGSIACGNQQPKP